MEIFGVGSIVLYIRPKWTHFLRIPSSSRLSLERFLQRLMRMSQWLILFRSHRIPTTTRQLTQSKAPIVRLRNTRKESWDFCILRENGNFLCQSWKTSLLRSSSIVFTRFQDVDPSRPRQRDPHLQVCTWNLPSCA